MGYPLPKETALRGPFAPMRFEATVQECIVSQGEIPKDLAGGYYRVGPTWKRPTKQGTNPLTSMDGMVQGITFENGHADFRNRWVRTPKYLLEEKHQRGMFAWADGGFHDWRDFAYGDVERDAHNRHTPQGVNNINVFPFNGQMVVSGEQGCAPMALDPITLETKGIVDWSPALSPGIHEPVVFGDNAFTAHPKWDHDTGVLYGWTYRDTAPYVTLHTVHPDGLVVSRDLWDAPYNTVAHDIWLTPEWMVMPFQPFIFGKERIAKGLGVWGWDTELPIILALIPRDDVQAKIRWITTELPAQYVMHTMSANVKDGKLILDAPIFNRPPFPFEQDFAEGDDVKLFFSIASSTLGRWTVDLATGATTSEQLSDRPSELPKVDERFYGKGYRWGYQVGGVVKRNGMSMNSLVVTNMETLSEQVYQIRAGDAFYRFAPPKASFYGTRDLLRTNIPVYLAAMGPNLQQLCGEKADGWLGYFTTRKFMEDVVRPNIGRGARRAGRDASQIDLVSEVVCSVSPDRKLAIARAKHQLGFYLMHPVSDGPVATLGLQDAVADLRAAARANGPAAFVNTDERLVDAFSISGTPEEARQKLAEYRDIVPHVVLHTPYVPPFTAEESDDAYRNIITTFGPTRTPF